MKLKIDRSFLSAHMRQVSIYLLAHEKTLVHLFHRHSITSKHRLHYINKEYFIDQNHVSSAVFPYQAAASPQELHGNML